MSLFYLPGCKFTKYNPTASDKLAYFCESYLDAQVLGCCSKDFNAPKPGDTVLYVACTIHPFDTEIVWKAFDIDPNAQYGDYDATYAEVIQTMAGALSGTFDEK